MKYQFINCTNCNYALVVNRMENEYLYGSPIQSCPRCGQKYIDKNIHELALDGGRFDERKSSPMWIWMIIIGSGMTAFSFLDTQGLFWIYFIIGVLFFGLGVICTIEERKNYKKRMIDFQKEAEESEKRLQQPEYAKLLKELGYNVPHRYLKD